MFQRLLCILPVLVLYVLQTIVLAVFTFTDNICNIGSFLISGDLVCGCRNRISACTSLSVSHFANMRPGCHISNVFLMFQITFV